MSEIIPAEIEHLDFEVALEKTPICTMKHRHPASPAGVYEVYVPCGRAAQYELGVEKPCGCPMKTFFICDWCWNLFQNQPSRLIRCGAKPCRKPYPLMECLTYWRKL